MSKWIPTVILVASHGLSVGIASAQVTEAQESKEAAIRELLVVTKAQAMGEQVLDQIFGMQRQMYPQVPDEFWQRVRGALDTGELVEITVEIYDRHFSFEEIQGLNAFYATPLGQRLVETLPKIMAESMQAGAAWGKRAMEKLQEELRDSGYSRAADSGPVEKAG